MNRISYAPEDFSNHHLMQRGLVLYETEWAVPEDLPLVDLIELYLEIEASLSADRGIVVQFIGASAGPGSAVVALDMAWAAVSMLGKKLLVLNCTQTLWTRPTKRQTATHDETMHQVSVHDDLVKIAGHEMYMADLRNWQGRSGSIAKIEEVQTHLEELCHDFDMVILVAPPADSEPMGAVLARHVDGNILVIEAEQTRRSAAVRLRETLSRCGGAILGAVLHDRQNHVPHWLTRAM